MTPAAYVVPGLRVSLVRDGSEAVGDVRDAAGAAAVLVKFLYAEDRENLLVLLLDGANRPLGVNLVGLGTVNAGLVHPREVFKPAILAGAVAIVVAHNHPSGNLRPSPEDRTVTARLVEAGKILGIAVVDHLILGRDGAFSSVLR